jgi:hypothetical protein
MTTLVAIVFAGALACRAYTHVQAALAGRSRRLRSLGATPVTVAELVAMAGAAHAELGSGVFDQHVVVSGTAEPAEHGVLEAPFSATPCVWYRAMTIRVVLDQKGRTRHEIDADITSRQGFRLVDDGAELLVRGGATPIEGATQTLDQLVESPDDGIDLGLVRIVSSPDPHDPPRVGGRGRDAAHRRRRRAGGRGKAHRRGAAGRADPGHDRHLVGGGRDRRACRAGRVALRRAVRGRRDRRAAVRRDRAVLTSQV